MSIGSQKFRIHSRDSWLRYSEVRILVIPRWVILVIMERRKAFTNRISPFVHQETKSQVPSSPPITELLILGNSTKFKKLPLKSQNLSPTPNSPKVSSTKHRCSKTTRVQSKVTKLATIYTTKTSSKFIAQPITALKFPSLKKALFNPVPKNNQPLSC